MANAPTAPQDDGFKAAIDAADQDIAQEQAAGDASQAAAGAQQTNVAEGQALGGGAPEDTNTDGQLLGGGAPNTPGNPLRDAGDLANSAAAGVLKGLFETKDFVVDVGKGVGNMFGQDNSMGTRYEDKSQFRKDAEDVSATMARKSGVNALAGGITQFGIGFVGLGKLKWLKGGAGVGGMVVDTGRGALASVITTDPHAARLSNFIQSFPALENPVTHFLAAAPDDSAAMGRFKNALENLLVPAAVTLGIKGTVAAARGVKALVDGFSSSVEAVKLNQLVKAGEHGDIPAADLKARAEAAQEAADAAFAKAGTQHLDGYVEGYGMADAPGASPKAVAAKAEVDQKVAIQEQAADAKVRAPVKEEPAPTAGDVAAPPSGEPVAGARDGGNAPGAVRDDSLHGEPNGASALAVDPDTIAKGLARARGDIEATNGAGSVGAAQTSGHIFKGNDLIPWGKFTAPDEVMTWMDTVVHDNAPAIHAVRGGDAAGHMTDAAVNKSVDQWVKLGVADPDLVRGALLQAGEDSRLTVAKVDTAFTIAQQGFHDTYLLAQRIANGNYAGFFSPDHAIQALKDRMVGSLEMFAAAKAMVANAARITRRGQMAPNVDISKLQGDDLVNLILGTDGNMAAMAKVDKSLLARIVDWATMNQAAGLLWGWATQTVNFGANIVSMYGRPGLQWLGAQPIRAGNAILGNDPGLAAASAVARAARKEIMMTHTTIADGWNAAAFAFMSGDSRIAPHTSEVTAAGMANRPGGGNIMDTINMWKNVQGWDDVVYNAWVSTGEGLSLPLRVMGGADEAVKTMRYRAVVLAKADGEALEKGLVPGSKDYKDLLELRAREAFDPEGAATDLMALKEARETAFQSQLIGSGTNDTWAGWNSFGANVQRFVNAQPPLRFMAPFVQTPFNLFRQGVRLTPGLNLLQKQYLNEILGHAGPAAQSRATGEMMFGVMMAGLGVSLTLQGKVTGSGPSDPKEAKAWREAGNMPDSLVFTRKDGTKSYFQLNRWDPFEAPFVIYAEITSLLTQKVVDEDKANTMVASVGLAMANLFKNKTMIKNVTDILKVFTEGDENKVSAYFSRTLPGMTVPASSLLRMVNQDPYLREVRGVLDAYKATIPGLSSTLPPVRDPFGDKVTIGGAIRAGEGPDHGKFTSAQDPRYAALSAALDTNYAATGHYIQNANPRTGPAGGEFDMRDLELEGGRNAFDRYQELVGHPKGMPSLKEALNQRVQSAEYRDPSVPHGAAAQQGTKENMIESLLATYREAAKNQLMAESKIFRDRTQKGTLDFLARKQAGAKDVNSVAAAAAVKKLNPLLGQTTGFTLPEPTIQPAREPMP